MWEPSSWSKRGLYRRAVKKWLGTPVLPGSKSRAEAQGRFPRNVGDPVVSMEEKPEMGLPG